MALCVLNFSGYYGGAEKRYVTLFNRLMEDRSDYFLIINKGLYHLFVSYALLQPHEKILIFDDKSVPPERLSSPKKGTPAIDGKRSKSKLRLFLGGWKYFFRTLLMWLRFSWFFIRQVRNRQIAKLYGVWQGGIWTWMWCKLLHVKLIYSVNASGKLLLYRKLSKFFDSQYWVLQYAESLDFLSPSLADIYQKEMGNRLKGRLFITPNSFIDYTNYFSKPPKKPWVVFLGRLESLKNPMLFLAAVNELLKQNRNQDVTFYVMGTGRMMRQMQQYVVDQKIERVVFTGLHPHPWEILQKSSVFVSLQTSENYPSQSLLEAMACENGIVVTDVGDTRKLIGEDEGLLVELNGQEVTNAIDTFLNNPELRAVLGAKARQKAISNHTLERFVKWFDTLMCD